MLTFNIKKEWFDKIKSGEKTHEYREFKDYWTTRIVKDLFFGDSGDKKVNPSAFSHYKHIFLDTLSHGAIVYYKAEIQFMNGMLSEKTKPRIYANMKTIRIINGLNTDLKIDKPVYDIEFELIEDLKND